MRQSAQMPFLSRRGPRREIPGKALGGLAAGTAVRRASMTITWFRWLGAGRTIGGISRALAVPAT